MNPARGPERLTAPMMAYAAHGQTAAGSPRTSRSRLLPGSRAHGNDGCAHSGGWSARRDGLVAKLEEREGPHHQRDEL